MAIQPTHHQKPNRGQARYFVEDYRPTLGHYHTVERARVEYFWVIAELDLKVHFVNPDSEMVHAWKTILSMAKRALSELQRENRDHPRPLHLTKGMSRLEREVGMRASARALKMSPASVRALIESGQLQARRTRGGKCRRGNYRITLDAILVYQEKVAVTVYGSQSADSTSTAQPKPKKALATPLLRAGELARLTGVSRSTIYRMKRRELISGVLVASREERFAESAVDIIRARAAKRP